MIFTNLFALFSLTRPINSLMIGLAVVVGIAIGSPELLFSRLALSGFITGFAISGYSMVINDVYDIEIDKINQPKRPLPQGIVSIRSALILSLILLLLGLFSSVLISYNNALIATVFALLSWFYNLWGKKNGIIGNFIVASSMSIPFIFGGIITTGSLSLLVLSISIIAFLSGVGREIIKTISDIEGDKVKGIRSIAITFGPKIAARIASVFIFLSIIVSFVPIYYGLIEFYYLPLLLITDLLFMYSIYQISLESSKKQSLKTKTTILYAMLLGLITFLFNSFT